MVRPGEITIRRLSFFALVAGLWVSSSALAEAPGDVRWVPGSTRKICQLTGDLDRGLKKPTLSQTATRYGVDATDLGSSFEHKGRLYFLFGDTKGRPDDWDALAWTDSKAPDRIVLEFPRAEDGKWLPPKVPGVSQKGFEIPSGGVSVGGTMYVVFTTDHSHAKVMGRSVLAASADDGRSFRALYELSHDKFINVSILPADGWLYIYGSGEYRRSSVCLARIRPEEIADRPRLRYWAGAGADDQARWSEKEADASPLFHHDVVGEFSVAHLAPVGRYVLLYNDSDGEPRGVLMRSAPSPAGPWSEAEAIFEPWRDGGYGHFMHISSKYQGAHDAIGDPDRAEVWGSAYGPYVMGRFTTGSAGRCRIDYTLSTWNPYQVVIMTSELELRPPSRPSAGVR